MQISLMNCPFIQSTARSCMRPESLGKVRRAPDPAAPLILNIQVDGAATRGMSQYEITCGRLRMSQLQDMLSSGSLKVTHADQITPGVFYDIHCERRQSQLSSRYLGAASSNTRRSHEQPLRTSTQAKDGFGTLNRIPLCSSAGPTSQRSTIKPQWARETISASSNLRTQPPRVPEFMPQTYLLACRSPQPHHSARRSLFDARETRTHIYPSTV
ncbi:hypothetical protein BDY19DRAFT_722048 [Irpex rosettiformis]|uniref:Uncharacterized protein n=1 Tax=Irpex rosettiformis TaxID=378272 RepID=A0ACB8U8G2_9APHY|nr:hypothetical protein BDY19DRAFT_722048 [Irpex rosettiformis]